MGKHGPGDSQGIRSTPPESDLAFASIWPGGPRRIKKEQAGGRCAWPPPTQNRPKVGPPLVKKIHRRRVRPKSLLRGQGIMPDVSAHSIGYAPGHPWVQAAGIRPSHPDVVELAKSAADWIRPFDRWAPKSHNPDRQFSSLARHLLAAYDVPLFGREEKMQTKGRF